MPYRVFSSIPGLSSVGASGILLFSCDDQKCLQTLPNVPQNHPSWGPLFQSPFYQWESVNVFVFLCTKYIKISAHSVGWEDKREGWRGNKSLLSLPYSMRVLEVRSFILQVRNLGLRIVMQLMSSIVVGLRCASPRHSAFFHPVSSTAFTSVCKGICL